MSTITYEESKKFCEDQKRLWLKDNPYPNPLIWSAQLCFDRQAEHHEKWKAYIKPIYEEWINSKGFEVVGVDEELNLIAMPKDWRRKEV